MIVKSPYHQKEVSITKSACDVEALISLMSQQPLACIGVSVGYNFDEPSIQVAAGKSVSDLASINPQFLALSASEPGADGPHFHRYLIDLQSEEVLPAIQKILNMSVSFVGFNLKMSLCCMWKLGLTAPNQVWDCFIFEKARTLGRYHYLYFMKGVNDRMGRSKAKERAEEEKNYDLSLEVACLRYGVGLSCFVDNGSAPCNGKEAMATAAASAKLYACQTEWEGCDALLSHCLSVEMPWVVTNADIEWAGVRVDYDKALEIVEKIQPVTDVLLKSLSEDYGIENPRSHNDIDTFIRREGLLRHFQKGGQLSLGDDELKAKESLHPAIPKIRRARKLLEILSNKILQPGLAGVDGRVRPIHTHLGADTGRQTCCLPNVAGLNRRLKPVIVPPKGFGIGEIDLSQIEPGIAGAYYNDTELISMFNSGDVYAEMAKICFRDSLSDSDLSLKSKDFKIKYPDLRSQMKVCTLGLIYGMTPYGIAQNLNISEAEATVLQNRFMGMFPELTKALAMQKSRGATRGYATTVNGLKRYRGFSATGRLTFWEKNWFANFPVQGSAAVVFKAAGNELYHRYKPYGARLIIPVHDSFVVESPLDRIEEVAALTGRIMCETVRRYFPELDPKADINILHPECWNKDGCLGFKL